MASQLKTEQEMFPLVESWLQSGLTQKQFCATYQMPVHILAYWVGRYRQAQPGAIADKGEATTGKMSKKAIATESASGFIRLSPSAPIPTPAPIPAQLPTGSMEVILPTGAIIRFSTTVAAAYLKELLSICSH